MVARRKSVRPAISPENREGQLVSQAMDLAERQMLEGTASAQVITHFLKLGSTRERLEQDKLRKENSLLTAKVEAMQSSMRSEELYERALAAMRSYSGQDSEEDYE